MPDRAGFRTCSLSSVCTAERRTITDSAFSNVPFLQVFGDFDPQSPTEPLARQGETLRSADPQPATAGPTPVSLTVRRPNVLFGCFVEVAAVAMRYCQPAGYGR